MLAKNIKLFIEELSIRLTTFEWSDIMKILRDNNQLLVNTDNLMTAYGTIQMTMVREHVITYIQTEECASQDL
jgi:hypothetical protein